MIVEEFIAWIGKAEDGERADGAFALVRLWLSRTLTTDEQEAAEAAITALLDDPCREVREALALELGGEPAAPRHVVLALAVDEPSVALPVLTRSPLLLTSELAEMVIGGSREHQIAIACREGVGAPVGAAVAAHACRDACFALLANDSAAIAPADLHTLAQRHGADTEIRRKLLRRRDLAPASRLLLIDRLADCLRDAAGDGDLPPLRVEAMVAANRDKAIVAWASRAGEEELPGIVCALVDAGRLTAGFLLRAVCMGNLALFAAALARLSGLAGKRVEAVLAENRQAAFRAIYVKAGMPDAAFEVFSRALSIWRRGMAERGEIAGAELVYSVTKELLAAFGARSGPEFEPLLVLLRRLAAEAARENARLRVNRIAIEAATREALLLEAAAEARREAEETARLAAIAEQFPVLDVPPQALASFAMHLAEEILELETQPALPEPRDEAAEFTGLLEAANDRLSNDNAPVIDMGEARRLDIAA